MLGAPKGFRLLGSVAAAPGADGWLAVNLAFVSGIPEGDAFRAWPAGWLPVAGA